MPAAEIGRVFDQFNWQARHPRFAGVMRLLAKIPIGRGRTLYDLFVRHPIPNGRLLPTDPRAIEAIEADGIIAP